jgi:hypothetical protein
MFKNKKSNPWITLIYALSQVILTIYCGTGAICATEQKNWFGVVFATILAAGYFAGAVKNLLRANAEVDANRNTAM